MSYIVKGLIESRREREKERVNGLCLGEGKGEKDADRELIM